MATMHPIRQRNNARCSFAHLNRVSSQFFRLPFFHVSSFPFLSIRNNLNALAAGCLLFLLLMVFPAAGQANTDPFDVNQALRRVRVTVDTSALNTRIDIPIGSSIVSSRIRSTNEASVDSTGLQITNNSGASKNVEYDLLITASGSNMGVWSSSSTGGVATVKLSNINQTPSRELIAHALSSDGSTSHFSIDNGKLDSSFASGVEVPDTPLSIPEIDASRVTPSKGTGKRVLASYVPRWANEDRKWSNYDAEDNPTELYKISSSQTQADKLAAKRQIEIAVGGGIDAFLVSVNPKLPTPPDPWTPTWSMKIFETMLDAADEYNQDNLPDAPDFAMASYIETISSEKPPPAGTQAYDEYLSKIAEYMYRMSLYGSHESHLKVDGRPVLVMYWANVLPAQDWSVIFGRLSEKLGSSGTRPFVIAEFNSAKPVSDYLPYFDGLHRYNPLPYKEISITPYQASYAGNMPETEARQSRNTKSFSLLYQDKLDPVIAFDEQRKLWMATVLPGEVSRANAYNVGARYFDRLDGDTYREMWNMNSALNADWVMISTWNEYIENTHITDTLNYGDFYLGLTRDYANALARELPSSIERGSIALSGAFNKGETPTLDKGNSQQYAAISANGEYAVLETSAPLAESDTNGVSDVYRLHLGNDGSILDLDLVSYGINGPGDRGSHEPSISENGMRIAFSSHATNLIQGDEPKCALPGSTTSFENCSDIFVKDMGSGVTSLVSTLNNNNGTQVSGHNYYPAISADGNFVAFASGAAIDPLDNNSKSDIYRKDVAVLTGGRLTDREIRLVSSTTNNAAVGNNNSITPSISRNGEYIAFASNADNLLGTEANGNQVDANCNYDVFLKSISGAGTLQRISPATSTLPSPVPPDTDKKCHERILDGASLSPSISSDGRYVAFMSYHPVLGISDTDSIRDIYVTDTSTSQTLLMSRSAGTDGAIGNENSWWPEISGDGRYVVFSSLASNLTGAEDPDGKLDVFRKRILDGDGENRTLIDSGEVVRVSESGDGSHSDATSGTFSSAIDQYGNKVAFISEEQFVIDDYNQVPDVYIKNMNAGQSGVPEFWAQPGARTGGEASDASRSATVSADGRFTVFESDAANLIDHDINGSTDVFLRDNWTGQVSLVSSQHLTGKQDSTGRSYDAAISVDGKFVVFVSTADELLGEGGDPYGTADIFIKEIDPVKKSSANPGGRTIRVSTSGSGGEANGDSFQPAISADKRYVVFSSVASNLVVGDGNLKNDIFRKELFDDQGNLNSSGQVVRVSQTSSGGGNDHSDGKVSVSGDGRYVTFASTASNLVANDTNGIRDVFLKDLGNDSILLVSPNATGPGDSAGSHSPSMTADARKIAFVSDAGGLVGNDDNGLTDVFINELKADDSRSVSLVSAGITGTADGYSGDGFISADGRYVSFVSNATNMLDRENTDTSDDFYQAYLLDTEMSKLEVISTADGGTRGNGDSNHPSIAADGRTIAFSSHAANLVPHDSGLAEDIFVAARQPAFAESIGDIAIEYLPGSQVKIRADLLQGVDAGTAAISVDGNLLPPEACEISVPDPGAGGSINCIWESTVSGEHGYTVSVKDLSGKMALASGSFSILTDSQPPSIGQVLPMGQIYTTATTINVDYTDDSGSGVDAASVQIRLNNGTPLTGCSVTAVNASCPVNGLAKGPYQIGGSVEDLAGNVSTITGSFEVTGRPQTITINAQGGGCDQIGQWDISTKTCTLTEDSYFGPVDGITISADGVTLDGGGHKLTGTGGNSGVIAEGLKDINVRNLVIEQFWLGVYYNGVGNGGVKDNSRVKDSTLSGNDYGIFLSNSANILVSGNSTSGNSNTGIYGWTLSQSEIRGNKLIGNLEGMRLYSSSNNSIYGNSFLNNSTQALVEGGSGNVFSQAMPVGGNYWSNFDTQGEGCADSNSPSGICDSAYVIRAGIPLISPSVQDNLPWTSVAPDSPSFRIIVKQSQYITYLDYLNRQLSVTYEAYNRGSNAHDVSVLEPWVSNSAITRISTLPQWPVVDRTEKIAFVIKYQVPAGVFSFQNRITISQIDGNGVSGESTMETTTISS